MKRIFHYIERTRLKPITAYHGTTDVFLREILKKGMVPDPSKKKWDVDTSESSLGQISLSSLGGSYWTTNLMTAMSSARHTTRKFGGEQIIVIASIVPESAVADEDDITFKLIGNIDMVMRELKYIIEIIGNIALIFGDVNYKDILKKGSVLLAQSLHPQWASNPEKNPIPYDMLEQALLSYLQRQAVFGVRNSQEESDWKTNYQQGYEYSVNYKDKLEWDSIPLPEELFGSKADVERNFKKSQDALTVYYKELARKARDEEAYNATFRILEPVTYSGRNRIISIIRMTDDENLNTVLELLYGESPSEFEKQYLDRVGGDLEWIE